MYPGYLSVGVTKVHLASSAMKRELGFSTIDHHHHEDGYRRVVVLAAMTVDTILFN